MLAWWFPLVAIIGGLFVLVWLRTAGWVIALSWMGTPCMLNARRCKRTHRRRLMRCDKRALILSPRRRGQEAEAEL
jgi:hypothetical protein